MKKQYTKKQITEAIAHWKGVLEEMEKEEKKQQQEAEAEDSSKAEDRTADLDAFADMVYSFIKNSVEKGLWKPEYEGEQPTRERIEASLPWSMVIPEPTAEEKSYVMDKVYPKLRKNSVFSKMKKAMRGEED